MKIAPKMQLYAALSSNVGTLSVKDFYEAFNHVGFGYSEFYFDTMKDIFYLQGMEKWHCVLNDESNRNASECLIKLVCFEPPQSNKAKKGSLNRQLLLMTQQRDCFMTAFFKWTMTTLIQP